MSTSDLVQHYCERGEGHLGSPCVGICGTINGQEYDGASNHIIHHQGTHKFSAVSCERCKFTIMSILYKDTALSPLEQGLRNIIDMQETEIQGLEIEIALYKPAFARENAPYEPNRNGYDDEDGLPF